MFVSANFITIIWLKITYFTRYIKAVMISLLKSKSHRVCWTSHQLLSKRHYLKFKRCLE